MPLLRAGRLAGLAGVRLTLKTSPVRVGYISAQGQGNIGDDIMFALTREALSPSKLVPLAFPRQERRLALLRLSGHSYFRSILLAGGTLINPIWAELARTAIALQVPLWTLGTGVGSCGFYQNENVDLQEWVEILRQATKIGVRGPLSAERLVQLGVPGPVEIVGDVALLSAKDRVVPPAHPPKVLVNLALQGRPESENGVLRAERSVAMLLSQLTSRGFRVVLVAMHPADVPRLRSLAAVLGVDDLPIHTPSAGGEFLALAEDCLFAMCVRLHAGILSCCAGVPVLMLAYRDKCIDFMRSMELEEWCIDLREPSSGARVGEDGLRMVGKAEAMREVVLKRSLRWKETLLAYIQHASNLYAPRTARLAR